MAKQEIQNGVSKGFRGGCLALLAILVFSASVQAQASRLPRLDRAYQHIEHPIDDSEQWRSILGDDPALSQSSLPEMLAQQSPVRDQGERSTCSIFSAVAWMESYFIRNARPAAAEAPDFSEEWLEYLAVRRSTEDGSEAPTNFSLIARHGLASEAVLPYRNEDWTGLPKRLTGLRRERCGHLNGVRKRESCLITHFDPDALDWTDEQLEGSPAAELLLARRDSDNMLARLKERAGGEWPRATAVKTVSEVKALLRAGIPLVLDLDFFLGAWNYDDPELPEISTSPKQWRQGIVGYPEKDSMDRKLSKKGEYGHSVLCVGYDDNIEVETRSRMKDGSMKSFRYRGVYFFKNSWGTDGFGKRFYAQGVSAPGYGMITQKYAHEFGGFFRARLPESKL